MWKFGKKNTENEGGAQKSRLSIRRIKWNILSITLAVAVVVGVLWLIFGFLTKPDDTIPNNYRALMDASPEITGEEIALVVNGIEIDEDVWRYYFMQNATKYSRRIEKELTDIDWNAKVGEETVLEQIKYDTIMDIMKNISMAEKATEWGIEFSDSDMDTLTELDGKTYQELGLAKEDTVYTIRKNLIMEKKLRDAVTLDVDKYMDGKNPNEYASDKSATIKMIEIYKDNDELAKQHIDEVAKRLKKGEDFNKLWGEVTKGFYKTDIGASVNEPDVLWVYEDAVDKRSRKLGEVAFSLKINEVSDIVETESSYLIIKRVAGYTEVENLYAKECELKINKKIVEATVVK
ncbi:MAG: hypothetical protein E7415_01010 [Ruminococcaceae bacterium]|nr:hypothetical protein [Oscillospiraceae bacterium]